jgi:hypothetical protein
VLFQILGATLSAVFTIHVHFIKVIFSVPVRKPKQTKNLKKLSVINHSKTFLRNTETPPSFSNNFCCGLGTPFINDNAKGLESARSKNGDHNLLQELRKKLVCRQPVYNFENFSLFLHGFG